MAKRLKIKDLIRIALLHAEASTSIDDPGMSAQFRAYRIKRFGRSRHDIIMDSCKPSSLVDELAKLKKP